MFPALGSPYPLLSYIFTFNDLGSPCIFNFHFLGSPFTIILKFPVPLYPHQGLYRLTFHVPGSGCVSGHIYPGVSVSSGPGLSNCCGHQERLSSDESPQSRCSNQSQI